MSAATDVMILETLGAIREQIGAINAKLKSGEQTHAEFRENFKEFRENFDMLDRRTDITEDGIVEIKEILAPKEGKSLLARVKNLEEFVGRFGAVIGVASAVLGGAMWLIGTAVSWIFSHWNEIRTFLSNPFK